jgi:hypothetical protein
MPVKTEIVSPLVRLIVWALLSQIYQVEALC